VADEEIRRLDSKTSSLDKSNLTFVVIANSSRCGFNKNRYDATIVCQYRTPVGA